MTLDKWFEIKQGREFYDMPLEIRNLIFLNVSKDELGLIDHGRADNSLVQKMQSVYDAWYNLKNPTIDQRFQESLEAAKRSELVNLELGINRKSKRLEQLNEMAKMDIPLPAGERHKLNTEISEAKNRINELSPPIVQPQKVEISEHLMADVQEMGLKGFIDSETGMVKLTDGIGEPIE